ncbi:MAG: rhomboid family intramembrane serine protease, partial [bacterium]
KGLIQIILLVAFVTGLLNFIFFPRVSLRGASGVVFAFIVLASITGSQKGTIPVTLLIVMALYLSKEVFQGLTVNDNVSNITHIIGGLVGAFYGLFLT